jgi:hypothetical protein
MDCYPPAAHGRRNRSPSPPRRVREEAPGLRGGSSSGGASWLLCFALLVLFESTPRPAPRHFICGGCAFGLTLFRRESESMQTLAGFPLYRRCHPKGAGDAAVGHFSSDGLDVGIFFFPIRGPLPRVGCHRHALPLSHPLVR